jgi:hypothetical protein
LCRTTLAATCGTSIDGTTITGYARIDDYPCGTRSDPSTEQTYAFVAQTSGSVTATITPTGGADLDLNVVGAFAATGGCDVAGACLGAGSSVTFAATAGATYYLVVDGVTAGEFSLSVACN